MEVVVDGDGVCGVIVCGVCVILNGNVVIEVFVIGEIILGLVDMEFVVLGDGEEVSLCKNFCIGFVFIFFKIVYIIIVLYDFFGFGF